MDATFGRAVDRITGPDPSQRSQALADARRRSSQAALQNSEAAEARKSEQREMLRAILEQAVGANTRLSIARNDTADTFIYRAIDIESGNIVKEWPPVQFARFLEKHGGVTGITDDALAGLMLDELT